MQLFPARSENLVEAWQNLCEGTKRGWQMPDEERHWRFDKLLLDTPDLDHALWCVDDAYALIREIAALAIYDPAAAQQLIEQCGRIESSLYDAMLVGLHFLHNSWSNGLIERREHSLSEHGPHWNTYADYFMEESGQDLFRLLLEERAKRAD